MNTLLKISAAVAVCLLGACASEPKSSDADYRRMALEIIKRDFQPSGQAKLDRLETDAVQQACNQYNNQPPEAVVKKLEAELNAGIKLPADGKFMGDWKEGEKLAQSGRGMTWTDKIDLPNGGNCYNCHQIGPAELSFGTIGPSLLGYGKLRGTSIEIQQYTYSKIYNAKAFNLCSEMPRFGHVGALDEKQIKNLVALLLDPNSPVNK